MAIRIITDSTADFTRDEAAQLGIEIVPLKTRFGDEEYIDGVTISPREFYEKLVESDVMPSTSQPSPAEFEATYDKVLAGGDEAVVITISGELSGTYQSAVIAAEKYPGRIAVVDSRSASIGAQILVRRAVQLAESAGCGGTCPRTSGGARARLCHRPARYVGIPQARRAHLLRRGLCGRCSGDKARCDDKRRYCPVGRPRARLKKRQQPPLRIHQQARRRGLQYAAHPGLYRSLRCAAPEICTRQRAPLDGAHRVPSRQPHRLRHRLARRPRRRGRCLFPARLSAYLPPPPPFLACGGLFRLLYSRKKF